MAEREFDAIVIGAGPGGRGLRRAARRRRPGGGAGRAGAGRRRVLLLRVHALEGAAAPGRAAGRGRAGAGRARDGLRASSTPRIVLERRDEVIHDRDDSSQLPWLEDARGRAGPRARDPRRRAHADRRRPTCCARAARSWSPPAPTAAVPPIEGLAEARPWTNREATTAERGARAAADPRRRRRRRRAGAGLEQPRLQRDAGRGRGPGPRRRGAVRERAGRRRARALRGRDPRPAPRRPPPRAARAGQVSLRLEGGDELRGDELLVAVGRRPRTDDIGLETVGVEPGGYLEIDDQLRVGGSRVAVRDRRRQRPRAAHPHGQVPGADRRRPHPRQGRRRDRDKVGLAAGRLHRAAGRGRRADARASARRRGLEVRAVDVETSANAGASFVGRNAPGTSRIVVDEDRGVIVGATFVGPEIAESLHAATIAVVAEVPLERLWHAVPVLSDPQRGLAAACSRSTGSRAAGQRRRRALSSSRKPVGKPGISSRSSSDSKPPVRSRWASTRPVWVTERPSVRRSS